MKKPLGESAPQPRYKRTPANSGDFTSEVAKHAQRFLAAREQAREYDWGNNTRPIADTLSDLGGPQWTLDTEPIDVPEMGTLEIIMDHIKEVYEKARGQVVWVDPMDDGTFTQGDIGRLLQTLPPQERDFIMEYARIVSDKMKPRGRHAHHTPATDKLFDEALQQYLSQSGRS